MDGKPKSIYRVHNRSGAASLLAATAMLAMAGVPSHGAARIKKPRRVKDWVRAQMGHRGAIKQKTPRAEPVFTHSEKNAAHRLEHRTITLAGIPRSKDGNRLGLRKRRAILAIG